MKSKIALMTAVMAFSYISAQENLHYNSPIKSYSKKVDSIVISEKMKMNKELDEIDKDFKEKKITTEEKQKQRTEIASKYEQIINEKIDSQRAALDEATRSMVQNAVFQSSDTLRGKNRMIFGFGGIKMQIDRNKETPKDYLRSWEFSISLIGANLTSKNQPFNFSDKNSNVRNTIVNSSAFVLRYENQIGGFRSPVFYRIGLGLRWDEFVPKYGKVFTQENNSLQIQDFTRGNLKDTNLGVSYIFIPADIKFVLNPKYIDYDGVKYLDNRKNQLTLIAGVYGGIRVGSSIYNRFSNDYSRRIVERERVMRGVNDLILGGKLGIGYAGYNFFIQKDFTPAFNNNAQLTNKYGLQIGFEITNLKF